MIVTINNFLDSYDELKSYSKECVFEDVENPADGVVYPYICAEIPENVRTELIGRLSTLHGKAITNTTIFLRMSPEGVDVPHMAHTDIVMGRYSFMLYLNDHPESGTALLRHKKTGIMYNPELKHFADLMVKDQNKEEAWSTMYKAYAAENRAAIFDSGFFHRAEPYGGFGKNQFDSRIVLTCFFT